MKNKTTGRRVIVSQDYCGYVVGLKWIFHMFVSTCINLYNYLCSRPVKHTDNQHSMRSIWIAWGCDLFEFGFIYLNLHGVHFCDATCSKVSRHSSTLETRQRFSFLVSELLFRGKLLTNSHIRPTPTMKWQRKKQVMVIIQLLRYLTFEP